MRAVLAVFIMLVVGGIVHIGSLFFLPYGSADDAFSRLSRLASAQGVTLLDESTAHGLPFFDAAISMGVCRYDLANGPFRVRTRLSDTFLTVVFAEDKRGIFSSVSDRAATGGALDVVVATPSQLARIAALDDKNEAVEEVRIMASGTRGIALIKVLVDRASSRAHAEMIIRDARCDAETLPAQ